MSLDTCNNVLVCLKIDNPNENKLHRCLNFTLHFQLFLSLPFLPCGLDSDKRGEKKCYFSFYLLSKIRKKLRVDDRMKELLHT